MNLKPINGHVLLKPEIIPESAFENATEISLGGKKFFVAKSKDQAKSVKTRCDKGDIISVAPDVTKVKPGDQVLMYPYSHIDFNLGGEDLAIVKEEDILLVAEKE